MSSNIFSNCPSKVKTCKEAIDRSSTVILPRTSLRTYVGTVESMLSCSCSELHKVAEMDVNLLAISECISLYYQVLAIITYQCNTRSCLKVRSLNCDRQL